MGSHRNTLLDHIAAFVRRLCGFFDVAAEALHTFEALVSELAHDFLEYIYAGGSVLDALHAAIEHLSALCQPHRPMLA